MSIIIRVHPQGGRIGADGLNARQRTFLRRNRRAVRHQNYVANRGLRAALRQASANMAAQSYANPYATRGYGQAMVGAYSMPSYSYGYPTAYASPYYAAASYSPFGAGFPFNSYASSAYMGAYAPVVPYGW